MSNHRSARRRSARSERGTVAAESSLVLIVLLFFLLMSPAIWKMWWNEHIARAEAERDTFRLTSTPADISSATNFQPELDFATQGDLIGLGLWELHKPETADIPNISDISSGNELKDFPNKVVIGRATRHVQYSSGWSQYRGEFDIFRYSYTLRPSWNWQGYPLFHTQDMSERGKIKDWMETAYRDTLTSTVTDKLALKTDPF